MITADLSTMEITVECSDGYRRRLIPDCYEHEMLVALASRLRIESVADTALNAVTKKAVLVKPGVRYDFVAALVQRYLEDRARMDIRRCYGQRNGMVLTYGKDDHYYVYETATQIVVQK